MKKIKQLPPDDKFKPLIHVYMIIYFFYGVILFFFGKEIGTFFENITILQKLGLLLILLGLFVYSATLAISQKKIRFILRFLYSVISIVLFILILSVIMDNLLVPLGMRKFFIIVITITMFFLSAMVTLKIIDIIKNINATLDDPTQKLTILIGFFGVLISLLTALK